jgi:hypothetical protein
VDPVAGTVSPYVTLPLLGVTAGSMAGHPDGGLYVPGVISSPQWGIVRVDPVTAAVTTFSPSQPGFGYLGMDVVRNVVGCPSDAKRTTWGRLKSLYR